jgi:hypothetical protein
MLAVMMGCHAQDLAVLVHLISPWILFGAEMIRYT